MKEQRIFVSELIYSKFSYSSDNRTGICAARFSWATIANSIIK
jgi:hypothetical protein